MPGKTVKNRLVIGAAATRLSKDDDVQPRELLFVLPKRFPHQPLQPIPAGRLTTMLSGNRKTEPRMLTFVLSEQDGK